MIIRRLTGVDASFYQALRLRALQEHPESFGRSYNDEKDIPITDIATRIDEGYPYRVSLGAFIEGKMCGMLGIGFEQHEKRRHRCHLGGMYVASENRGQGLGRQLLDTALTHIREREGVEIVILAVTVGNTPARTLYRSVGFATWGVDPAYIRVGERDYDIEWMALRL
ncbi:MAG: GNAT family N-acetyltransferase [Chloroflexota bacterium]